MRILIGLGVCLLASTVTLPASAAGPRTGVITGTVTQVYKGMVHEQSRTKICVVEMATESGAMGLLFQARQCEQSPKAYDDLVGQEVEIDRADYKPLTAAATDTDDLSIAKDFNSELYYARVANLNSIRPVQKARATIIQVQERIEPKARDRNAFGRKPICLVLAKADGNDNLGIVLDSEYCVKNNLKSLANSPIAFNRGDLEYLRSRSQIAALKTVAPNYFFKLMKDGAYFVTQLP